MVAGTRSANPTELAQALKINVRTFKTYNRELVDRPQVGSRQHMIERLLSEETARHEPLTRVPLAFSEVPGQARP
ncbi:hypothetical protein [Ottowia thiooxydans]|uniref:hypothetical protein n=1 Tax=Ottowia thiooxydans TaxID=219182 RepID=UPI000413E179|nr:hypothetical protein [Ottowia thiooxydans]